MYFSLSIILSNNFHGLLSSSPVLKLRTCGFHQITFDFIKIEDIVSGFITYHNVQVVSWNHPFFIQKNSLSVNNGFCTLTWFSYILLLTFHTGIAFIRTHLTPLDTPTKLMLLKKIMHMLNIHLYSDSFCNHVLIKTSMHNFSHETLESLNQTWL